MSVLLGYIPPPQRTQIQHDADAAAKAMMPRFALPPVQLAKGESIRLFDFWSKPEVVTDMGFVFTRIHQFTGSCVWAGGTNAVVSTITAQRMASENPTKAFMPFTLHNYAMSRHYMGDDREGQGSFGSTFAKSLRLDGVRDWPQVPTDNLPDYTMEDGICLNSATEMKWSSYRNPELQSVLAVSKAHLFGATTEAKAVSDIRSLIVNGYGISFACNNYIGNASIQGSGSDACLIGEWDTYGPHQQSIHAYWEHPNFGPLYWAQNSWPGSTYPRDPAGGPVCGCWVKESKVTAAMRLDAEVFGFSHLDWFPAQPEVLNYFV